MKKIYYITLVLLILSVLSVVLASCKGNSQKGDDKQSITVTTESETEEKTETSTLSETMEESVPPEIATDKDVEEGEIEETDITDDFEVELEENQGIGGF